MMTDLTSRQITMLDELRRAGRLSIRDLAQQYAISEMTARRDLAVLEAQGLLVRTHGGGVAADRLRFMQTALAHYTAPPEKAAIGRHAAALVQPGQTIMLDAGTTALEVARHLPHDASLTVATSSLCVAQELYGTPVTVILFGGMLRKDFPSLYGPLTEEMLRHFHVDTLFIGCDGARSDAGFYTADVHLASLERAMMQIADRVVVVTESTKFGHSAFSRIAAIEDVHTLVTDTGLAEMDRDRLAARGMTIVLAEG
jgi:DeoR/GlpR family transcriptional regulator of sugar metabolism